MKPLTFRHRFSNGIDCTVTVIRDANGRTHLESDKKDFMKGVEAEYLSWINDVATTVYEVSSDEERAIDFMEGLIRVAGL